MTAIDIDRIPLVSNYGNRACITDQVMEELPADLRQWVRDNCERPDNLAMSIWLLPVPKEDA